MEQERQLDLFSGEPSGEPDSQTDRDRERQKRVIQDLLLEEGFWAVTRADQHDTLESLEQDIAVNLKQQ